MMSGGGAAKEVSLSSSSADEQHANGAAQGDAIDRVLIGIRNNASGEIECTFRMPRSHKLQRIYRTLWEWREGKDSFILKLDGRRVDLGDTPDSLGMSDHIEILCVPAVKVDIRNFWTQKIECSFVIDINDSFHLIHNMCVKMRGNTAFDFSWQGRQVKLSETPSSLEMKNHVELTCVPVPMVEIIIKDIERPWIEEQRFVVRRCHKLSKIYLKYSEIRGDNSFFLIYNWHKLSLRETPDSLRMNDQVEIACVSSCYVIIDIFNVETQEVSFAGILESSASFHLILLEFEKNRLQHNGKSSFYLEFNGTRIDHDDTPNSLGMGDGDRVVVSYTPNPAVEIDLYKHGEFVRKFRLKPHQPLRTIYNSYSKLSFRLMFNGSKAPPEATPHSLGMKGHENLAWEQTVSIFIHNIDSGEIEYTFFDFSMTTCIVDYIKAQRTDNTLYHILTTEYERLTDTDTPNTLFMNGSVTLLLIPSVLISIRNSESQEVVRHHFVKAATFQILYDKYKEESGFDFTFNGVVVDLHETPNSLGLRNHAEFVYVPRLVNISFRSSISGEIEHRYHGSRAATFCSIKEEIIKKRNGTSALFDFWLDKTLLCENATPNSLMLEDNAEILLAPYVIIDVRDSVTNDVAPFELGRAVAFRILLNTYKKPDADESDERSFDFYFKGAIIDLDKDTPESLGMTDREEVECVPKFNDKSPKEECSCTNCRKRRDEARILGLDETFDMKAGVEKDKPSTIDIAFVDASSSDEVLFELRHEYDGKICPARLISYSSTNIHLTRCCYDMDMMRK